MSITERIIHHLILQSPGLRHIGLYHGKMGVVMTLYTYAQEKHDEELKTFAWELLQEIMNHISETLPVGLENGLAGIGYGITFLKRYAALEGDLNDILYEIDRKIMSYDPRRLSDISFRTGGSGIWYYLQMRLETESPVTSLDNIYCKELHTTLNRHGITDSKLHTLSLEKDLEIPQWDLSELTEKSLCLNGGAAFLIFKELKLT